MKGVRYCFGEDVDVYEVTGDSFTQLTKRVSKAVRSWEENGEYSWFQFQSMPDAFGDGTFSVIIYAH